MIHPDFYPATGTVHFEPLEQIAPDLVGEFMFMQADVTGRFYFKNSTTRDYVVLDDQGRAYEPTTGDVIPARRAVEEACGVS